MIESNSTWYFFRLVNVGVMCSLVYLLWQRFVRPMLIESFKKRLQEMDDIERKADQATAYLAERQKAHDDFLIQKKELVAKVIEWQKVCQQRTHDQNHEIHVLHEKMRQRALAAQQFIYKQQGLALLFKEVAPIVHKQLEQTYQDSHARSQYLSLCIQAMKGSS